MEGMYGESGRSVYDIGAPGNTPFPPNYMIGYLGQQWVQKALGVPLNYTESVNSVFEAFNEMGDYVRGGFLEDIAYILDSGIKVAMVYGDRDYICNLVGGEQVSLAIPYSGQQNFQRAGYAQMMTNDSYMGGMTRQHGNFSFTRVFQAGHEVPAYQPETAYEIFRRAMNNLDIATGKTLTNSPRSAVNVYSTTGPSDTFAVRAQPDPAPPSECYILAPNTCTEAQLERAENGTAQFKNFIYVGTKKSGKGKKSAAGRIQVDLMTKALIGVAVFVVMLL
jgi:hypothetical protein